MLIKYQILFRKKKHLEERKYLFNAKILHFGYVLSRYIFKMYFNVNTHKSLEHAHGH